MKATFVAALGSIAYAMPAYPEAFDAGKSDNLSRMLSYQLYAVNDIAEKSHYFIIGDRVPRSTFRSTGQGQMVRLLGDETGSILVDATPGSSCTNCPVVECQQGTLCYARPEMTMAGLNLVSSGIPLGMSPAASALGVAPEAGIMVCARYTS